MWKAHDADSRVWILGTVHVLPEHLQWRTPDIDAALNEADVLVMEVDPKAMAEPGVARAFDVAGRNPEGVTLDSELTVQDRVALREAAAKAGVDVNALQPYKPWMAGLRLSYAALAREGINRDHGVETVLTAWAAARGVPIEALETPDQQIGFFQKLSPETARNAFRQTLTDIGRGRAMLDVIDRLWANGDTAGLEAALLPDFKAPGEAFYRVILADRNAAWADAIAARMQGAGDVFVAVGAAHLLGPDSLPALLRARGIAVDGP